MAGPSHAACARGTGRRAIQRALLALHTLPTALGLGWVGVLLLPPPGCQHIVEVACRSLRGKAIWGDCEDPLNTVCAPPMLGVDGHRMLRVDKLSNLEYLQVVPRVSSRTGGTYVLGDEPRGICYLDSLA